MNNICVIPARGGSKRIPRKNIKDFFGKPIIAYAIQTALDSGLFKEVMVSTDDAEIKEIALESGATVPFLRSRENADDFSTTYDVLKEVVLSYENNGFVFDHLCCIYPCTPLNTVLNLRNAYDILINDNMDTVLPLVKYSTPIQRSFQLVSSRVESLYPEYELTRSQDLPGAYYDPGQFYWMNIEKLFNNQKIISGNTGYIILDEMQVQDMDNEIDWEMASLKYKHNFGKLKF